MVRAACTRRSSIMLSRKTFVKGELRIHVERNAGESVINCTRMIAIASRKVETCPTEKKMRFRTTEKERALHRMDTGFSKALEDRAHQKM